MNAIDRLEMNYLKVLDEISKQTKGTELPLTEDQLIDIFNSGLRKLVRKFLDSGWSLDGFVSYQIERIKAKYKRSEQ